MHTNLPTRHHHRHQDPQSICHVCSHQKAKLQTNCNSQKKPAICAYSTTHNNATPHKGARPDSTGYRIGPTGVSFDSRQWHAALHAPRALCLQHHPHHCSTTRLQGQIDRAPGASGSLGIGFPIGIGSPLGIGFPREPLAPLWVARLCRATTVNVTVTVTDRAKGSHF
jgi:hypothetical protein